MSSMPACLMHAMYPGVPLPSQCEFVAQERNLLHERKNVLTTTVTSTSHLKHIKNVSLAGNTVDYFDLLTKDLKQLVAEQR